MTTSDDAGKPASFNRQPTEKEQAEREKAGRCPTCGRWRSLIFGENEERCEYCYERPLPEPLTMKTLYVDDGCLFAHGTPRPDHIERRRDVRQLRKAVCKLFEHADFSAETWLCLFERLDDLGVDKEEFLQMTPSQALEGLSSPDEVRGAPDDTSSAAEPTPIMREGADPAGTVVWEALATRAVVQLKLKGKQRLVVELVARAGGRMPLQDLALAQGIEWLSHLKEPVAAIYDTFNAMKKELNRIDKLPALGWMLRRQDNCAVLMRAPTTNFP